MTKALRKPPQSARPAPPGEAEPKQKRKVTQILPAAGDLFAEKGFDAVTMDIVAARAGVSKATLYVYFPSKEDLFAAFVVEETRRINAEVTAPFADADFADRPIEAVLGEMAWRFVDIFLSGRSIAFQRALCGALPRCPQIGALAFAAGPADLIGRIAAVLTAAVAAGKLDIDDVDLAARQLVSLARDQFDLSGLLMLPPPTRAEIQHSIDGSVALFMARYGRK